MFFNSKLIEHMLCDDRKYMKQHISQELFLGMGCGQ